MKESLQKFTLTDFLAYFFPGSIFFTLTFIYLVNEQYMPVMRMMGTDEKSYIPFIIGSILAISVSYLLGIIFSVLINIFTGCCKKISKFNRLSFLSKAINYCDPIFVKSNPYVETLVMEEDSTGKLVLNQNFKDLMNHYFQNGELKFDFYALRGVVRKNDPVSTNFIERQSSLRQIKRNSVLMVLLCFYPVLEMSNIEWFILAPIFLLLVFALIMGIRKNRKFEVRDTVLAAFLCYKLEVGK